jgi:hypothetical protein
MHALWNLYSMTPSLTLARMDARGLVISYQRVTLWVGVSAKRILLYPCVRGERKAGKDG